MTNKTDKQRQRLDYQKDFFTKHYRVFRINAEREKDKDIIDWLEQKEVISDYIKDLIRKDMKR